MGIGPTEWLLIAVLVIVLFGSGRISGVMADVAKGIKAFRRGLAAGEPDTPAGPAADA